MHPSSAGKVTHLPRSACAPSRSGRVCSRHEAIELSRLCAARPDLSRVMLPMRRAFVFPTLCQECGFRLRGQLSGCCDPCRQPLSLRRLGAARHIAAASIRAQAGKVAVRRSGAGATGPASDGGVVRSGRWPVPISAPSTPTMSVTSRTMHSSAHEGRATSPRRDVAEPNVGACDAARRRRHPRPHLDVSPPEGRGHRVSAIGRVSRVRIPGTARMPAVETAVSVPPHLSCRWIYPSETN